MQRSIRSTGQGFANLLEHYVWPGIYAWWGRQYGQHTEEWSQMFDTSSSDKNYEEEVEVTGFGLAPVKNQGTAVNYDSETQGTVTRYTNIAYALGYITTREEMDDCLYEVVGKQRAGALAFSMRQTSENVHANIFNRGFDSNFVGGDGVELFATDHPSKSGIQSNELAVAADISEAAIESLIIQIMGAQNSRGLKINLMPDKIQVHRNDWFEVTRILRSTLQSGSATNDVNALNFTGAIPNGILINHYLTDNDAWFIKTNAPSGLRHFNRIGIEFTQDNDFDTENAKAKCYERYSAGWTDWRGCYASSGG